MDFRQLSQQETPKLYERALQLQASFYSLEDNAFFESLSFWTRVKSVLDVGCGPGAFLFAAEKCFENKEYLGIDIEAAFIETATKNFIGKRYEFKCDDFLKFTGKTFDCLIFWAVFQHLKDVDFALSKAKSLLKANGHIIVFDAGEEGEQALFPKVDLLDGMYEQLKEKGRQSQRNSKCIPQILDGEKKYGFSVEIRRAAEVPLQREDFTRFLDFSMIVSELLKRFYSVSIDQSKLYEQLQAWKNSPTASGTLTGGEWLVLKFE